MKSNFDVFSAFPYLLSPLLRCVPVRVCRKHFAKLVHPNEFAGHCWRRLRVERPHGKQTAFVPVGIEPIRRAWIGCANDNARATVAIRTKLIVVQARCSIREVPRLEPTFGVMDKPDVLGPQRLKREHQRLTLLERETPSRVRDDFV